MNCPRGNPSMCRTWFAGIIANVGRLAQLIRDLFSVKCSRTEALSRLLQSDPMASIPQKLGDSEGGLLRKMASGTFLAIWGAVTEVIVFSKVVISRKRA